jgi:hypothetical protein
MCVNTSFFSATSRSCRCEAVANQGRGSSYSESTATVGILFRIVQYGRPQFHHQPVISINHTVISINHTEIFGEANNRGDAVCRPT